MRRKKVLFIVNPRSGKGQIRNALLDIADIFIKGGLDVTLYVTQKPQDASRVVEKRAAKFDLVACSGGDGTLDEVVTGMMNSEISSPIGYIPAGTQTICKQPADPEKDDGSGTVYRREQRLSV